jgi:hypothetical protein
MNEDNRGGPKLTSVVPERVEPRDPRQLAHLAANRGIIVKRSLMVTAVGAVIPVPVMDEYVAGRVRAGLLMKLAQLRNVDLPPSAAELMGDPREASMVRNATLTAITLVALKLAWRKIFALLAAGRGAEEMVSNFQYATLFDHYCATMHVGGPVDRQRAADLRKVMHATVERTEKATLTAIFRDGGKILGRSLLEAPRWVSLRLTSLAQRWVSTRGDVSATFDSAADVAAEGENQWLDRASSAVESRLGDLGTDYLAILIEDFEARWAKHTSDAAEAAAKKPASAGASTGASPGETTPGDAGKSATETDTGGTPGGGRAN